LREPELISIESIFTGGRDHMLKFSRLSVMCGVLSSFAAMSQTASAAELIINGGFESGLSGWTTTDSADPSQGSFFADSDVVTPLTGDATVGAFAGTGYAVSDAFGPGSHALTQTFTAPVGLTSAVLSFEMFVDDEFGGSGLGGEVDLLAGGADPLGGVPLATFITADTAVVGGIPNPWVLTSVDITGDLVGGTDYELRFLESDANGPIHVGVDAASLNVTASAATPEPSTQLLTLLIAAGALLYVARRKSSRYLVAKRP
jgi:hypothetical protein